MRNFNIPPEEDEDMFATSPIPYEQIAETTPVPDYMSQAPMVNQEIDSASEIENETADLLARYSQKVPAQQEQGNLTEQDVERTSPKSVLDRYAELRQLQETQGKDIRNAGMLQGANQIAQGFAMGSGAKIGDGSESVKMLQQMAKQPVEDYNLRQKDEAIQMELGNEREMNDANSDISKFSQQRAVAIGEKMGMNPEEIQKLTNMTAKQLEKLGFKASTGLNQTPKPGQQSGLFGKSKDGKRFPLAWDGTQMKYINPLTGETVGPETEIERNTLYTDAFGNKISFGSEGASTIASSSRNMKSTEELNQETKFSPDKEQRSVLDDEAKRIDGLTKNSNEKIAAANRILLALDGDSKQALSVVKTQMPRLAGEVGPLNQQEQEMWKGSQALIDRAFQYVNTTISSELTEDNKKELRKILAPFLKDAKNSIGTIMDSSANRLAKVYNIPPDFTKSAYGSLKEISSRQEEVMSGKVETPKKSDKTKVKQDSKVSKFAEENKLTYEQANVILSKRGYKANE